MRTRLHTPHTHTFRSVVFMKRSYCCVSKQKRCKQFLSPLYQLIANFCVNVSKREGREKISRGMSQNNAPPPALCIFLFFLLSSNESNSTKPLFFLAAPPPPLRFLVHFGQPYQRSFLPSPQGGSIKFDTLTQQRAEGLDQRASSPSNVCLLSQFPLFSPLFPLLSSLLLTSEA